MYAYWLVYDGNKLYKEPLVLVCLQGFVILMIYY